jgi:hypothetical protein
MTDHQAISVTNVLECLQELADEKFQHRVWAVSSGPEVSSFSEAICGLFDDTGLGDAIDRGQDVFGKEADNLLWLIGREAAQIDRRWSPEQLLSSEQLRRIRELAAQALTLVQASQP